MLPESRDDRPWNADDPPACLTDAAARLEIAVYDETIRFNILIVDRTTCVVQPYLPQARGVDSPTLMLTDNTAADGLFPVFDQVFTSLWERSRPV